MYVIQRTEQPPALNGHTRDAIWERAAIAPVAIFHPRSKSRHPRVEARLLYDEEALFLRFEVDDRYVRSVRTNYQDGVCRDSCVEFFVEPKAGFGYFNFEINAGGTLLLWYITDCTRTEKGFREAVEVPAEVAATLEIAHSLPAVVEPEIQEPVSWTIGVRIPVALFERYVGTLRPLSGQSWRANFYKCADETSHPHWISWQPVGEPLNFHKPERFGQLQFA